ncbi:hypothetical protein KKD61_01050, partial [Patescibacteria group bacterium]|nr:hypothetical protein [Patescibacteria group bacterium]
MKFLLLRINQESYVPSRIKEEAEKAGHELDIFGYQDLSFAFHPGMKIIFPGNRTTDRYNACFLRVAGCRGGGYIGFRDNLIFQFLKQGKKCLNGGSYLAFSRLDKLTQHAYLSDAGLPLVETVCFGKNTSRKEFVRTLTNRFGFPLITKPRFGSQGKGIFLLKNERDLQEFYRKMKDEGYQDSGLWLFQKFLTTGFDYRIIVLGGKVLGAMKRTAGSGMIVTNFSQGGLIDSAKIDKEAKKMALEAAALFRLDYAGVDIMEDKEGNKYILE